MKQVSIPESKFILSLEDEENQWWLRLRINNAVEEEIPLTHLEKKTLRNNIQEVLDAAHVNLNELQINMLQENIWKFIQGKLESQKQSKKKVFGTIEDPRYNELVNRLDKLSEEIEELTDKISEQEKLLT